jgi:hypothetical protein
MKGTAMQEANNLFASQMGIVADEYGKLDEAQSKYYLKGEDYIQSMTKSFELNRVALENYTGAFFAMLKNQGIEQDTAYKMATSLTNAASDMASLFNVDFSTQARKLQSAIAGEVKGLRVQGINVDESSLQTVLNTLGIDRSVEQLSYAEKEVARYISIIRQAGYAQGDFAKTFNSTANQVKVLKEEIATFGQRLGTILNQAFGNLVVIARAIVMVLMDIINALGVILGVNFNDTGVQGATDTVSGLADAYDGVGASIGGASAAAKEFKKQLMGFDEINNITPPSSSSGSGGGGGGGSGSFGTIDSALLSAVGEWDNKMGSVRDKAKEIRDAIEKFLGFTKDSNGNITNLREQGEKLWTIIKGILLTVAAYKVLSWVGNLITNIQNIGGALKTVGGITSGLVKKTSLSVWLSAAVEEFKALRAAGLSAGKALLQTGKDLLSVVSPATKAALSLAGLALSANAAYNSAREFTLSGGEANEKLTQMGVSLATATASGAALGATIGSVIPGIGTAIGGAAGSVIGFVTGTVTALNGYYEAVDEIAKSTVFGDMTVTLDQWTKILDFGNTSLGQYAEGLANYQSKVKGVYDEFKGSMEGLSTDITQYSIGIKETTEQNLTETINKVSEASAKAETLIDESTTRGIDVLSQAFTLRDGMIDESEQDILTKLAESGEKKKETVKTAEDNATRVLREAIGTRGYLTEEERQYIVKQFKIISDIVNAHLDQSQTDLDFYASNTKTMLQGTNEEIGRLDQQSYENLKTAADNYYNSAKLAASQFYNETVNNLIEAGVSKEEAEKMANANRLAALNEATENMKNAEALGLSQVYAMYEEHKNKNDELSKAIVKNAQDQVAQLGLSMDEVKLRLDGQQGDIESFAQYVQTTTNTYGDQITEKMRTDWDERARDLTNGLETQGATLDTVTPTLVGKWEALGNASSTVYDEKIQLASTETQAVLDLMHDKVDTSNSSFMEVWGRLATDSSGKYNEIMNNIPAETKVFLKAMFDTTSEWSPKEVALWQNMALDNTSKYNEYMSKLPDDTKTTIETMTKKVRASGKDLVDEAGKVTVEVSDKVYKGTSGMTTKQLDHLDKQIPIYRRKGDALGNSYNEGYIEGILNKENDTYKASSSTAQTSLNAMGNTLDAHSPSRETKKYGEYFSQGYINGIRNYSDKAYSAGAYIAGRALKGVVEKQNSHSPSKETLALGDFFGIGYAEGIEETTRDVVKSAEGLAEASLGVLGGQTTNLPSALGDYAETYLSESETALNTIGSILDEVSDKELRQIEILKQKVEISKVLAQAQIEAHRNSSAMQDGQQSKIKRALANAIGIGNPNDYSETIGVNSSISSSLSFGGNEIVRQIAEAVSNALSTSSLNIGIEAKVDEGVIVKKVADGFNQSVRRTGSLPFTVPL